MRRSPRPGASAGRCVAALLRRVWPGRRVEFLEFMNRIVAAHTDTAIHVVLDNLNTHKPKNGRWLKRHRAIPFHADAASWLNQVEIWFSILEGKSLHRASF